MVAEFNPEREPVDEEGAEGEGVEQGLPEKENVDVVRRL
jgi:hypothetical protein